MAPADAHEKIDKLFDGAMKGRTMYVVPYIMGPSASRYGRCGVEITDSPYVVLNMRIMTRMGNEAIRAITAARRGSVVKGLHSVGDLDPSRRFIMHFPEDMTIKSIGSGYGGNALLGKKCHALRLASWQARTEGWLAEHMLIVGIESPTGKTHYIAAAFPSACGKTNLAMLIPPESLKGYKIWTVGDDICWMHPGQDGRLWAINPENGFFGVAPGTSPDTNPNALAMVSHDTIFTNVALTGNGEPWWEGLTHGTPLDLTDWQGKPYHPSIGPAAHPNSRFTVSTHQNPSFSPHSEDPEGVPISAIIFGGRRSGLMPLVIEAHNWTHGVFMGASMASETTAAATGTVGVTRRDPMAMRPFCGYNMADYWNHWLSFTKRSSNLPQIFHVNWFRRDKSGAFLWKGYGENLRVLQWIIERCEGHGKSTSTPIGCLPTTAAINTSGLDISSDAMKSLLFVDKIQWLDEMKELRDFFGQFGERMPNDLRLELTRVEQELMQMN
jgi:phosphoenolpyruvate carboxykinase (GTP)